MDRTKHDVRIDAGPLAITVQKEALPRRQRAAAKPASLGKLAAAREVVRGFLLDEFQAREVRITKISPAPGDPPGWYAEAEILVPDLGIKTLGLPLSQEVLERELCAVDLDGEMTVKSYEVLDPRDR